MKLPKDISKVYARSTLIFSKEEIERALDAMAVKMHERLNKSNPIFLCVLIGGIVPLGNLLPRLDFPLEVNYIHVTRYQGETSGGELWWKVTPSSSLKDRTVVVMDDILDEGLTLAAVMDYCKMEGANEVYSAVLLDKQKPRKKGGLEKADFHALTIDDRFVIGYGLDYDGYLRNAPGIYVVAPEDQ